MRLITRRIYRAFPELDRHPDEQCERFVLAARGGPLRICARFIMLCVVGTVAVIGGFVLTGLSVVACENAGLPKSTAGNVVMVLVLIVGTVFALVVAPATPFILRDWLLRRRVRYILRARGVCPGCRYSLVGLTVSPANTVICPECSMEGTVDPSLGELVLTDSGTRLFQPRQDEKPTLFRRALGASRSALASLVPKPVRGRFSRRTFALSACGLLLAVIGTGAFFIYRVTSAPTRPYGSFVVQLQDLLQKGQHGDRGSAAGRTALQKAYDILVIAEVDSRKENRDSTGIDYAAITNPLRFMPPNRAEDLAIRWQSTNALSLAEATGIDAQLDTIASTPFHAIQVPSGLLMYAALPQRDHVRRLARACFARMRLAAEAGDNAERLRAFEHALALGRLSASNYSSIDRLIGFGCASGATHRLIQDLQHFPLNETELLAAIAALDRQHRFPPIDVHIQSQRLAFHDLIQTQFSETGSGNGYLKGSPELLVATLGISGSAFGDAIEKLPPAGVAAFGLLVPDKQSHLAAIDGYFDGLQLMARTPASEWHTLAFNHTQYLDALSVRLMPHVRDISYEAKFIESNIRHEVEIAGTRIILALELHRLRHGEYPAHLDALVPGELAAIPPDPCNRSPWGYKRFAPGEDQLGRPFLLYSIGADQSDNGGHMADPNQPLTQTLTSRLPGFDFVINTPSQLGSERVTPEGNYPVPPSEEDAAPPED